jgi:hypothetical protein
VHSPVTCDGLLQRRRRHLEVHDARLPDEHLWCLVDGREAGQLRGNPVVPEFVPGDGNCHRSSETAMKVLPESTLVAVTV